MATMVKSQNTTTAKHILYALLLAAATIALGTIMGFIGGSNEGYAGLNRPPFTPPDVTFAVVWPILYFMMGISFYMTIAATPFTKNKQVARVASIVLFCVQLAVNVTWPLIFFRADMFYFAFIWLAVLDALVVALIIVNFRFSVKAALLLIPYFLWILFATYLNILIAVYN